MKTFYIHTNYDDRRAISLSNIPSSGANDSQTLWQDKEQIWKYNLYLRFQNPQKEYYRKFYHLANIHCFILLKQDLI